MNMKIMMALGLCAALTACGDDGGFKDEADDSGAPTSDDSGEPGGDDSGEPGGDDSGEPGGDDSGEPASITWAGTWLLQVDYPIDCEWAGSGRTDAHSGSWTLSLRGGNDALTVDINEGWYWMDGAGSNTSFFLSGSFPFEGISATATAQRQDNTVTFRAESVSASQVEGEVTGRFVDETGWDCDLNGASFVMSR